MHVCVGERKLALDAGRGGRSCISPVGSDDVAAGVSEMAVRERERRRSSLDTGEDLPGRRSGGGDGVSAQFSGGARGKLSGWEHPQQTQQGVEQHGGAKGTVRRHHRAGGAAVCRHQHRHVLQPHHHAVRGLCIQQDGHGAGSRHLRPQHDRLHNQHVLRRPLREEEAHDHLHDRDHLLPHRALRRLLPSRRQCAAGEPHRDGVVRGQHHLPGLHQSQQQRVVELHELPGEGAALRFLLLHQRRPGRGVPGVGRRGEEHVPGSEAHVVLAGVPEQGGVPGRDIPGSVHHSVLAGDGDGAVDRQLRDLSGEVQRAVRRDCGGVELDVESAGERDVPDADGASGVVGDVPSVRRILVDGAGGDIPAGAGDEGHAFRGGGENAEEGILSFQGQP